MAAPTSQRQLPTISKAISKPIPSENEYSLQSSAALFGEYSQGTRTGDGVPSCSRPCISMHRKEYPLARPVLLTGATLRQHWVRPELKITS